MAHEPRLIIQLARGGEVDRNLSAHPPQSVSSGDVVVQHEPTDAHGQLEPPPAGEVVLSVLSPGALAREADDVRRVITGAGGGVEPLVVVVEAAEELRDDELDAVLDATDHTPAPVILRIMRDA